MTMLTSRPYTDMTDFALMKSVLRASQQTVPTSGLHIGDLNWWVFYDTSGIPVTEKVRLWFDDDTVIGWTWIHWKRGEYEMALRREYHGSDHEAAIITYTVQALTAHVLAQPPKLNDAGEPEPRTVGAYAFADETARIALLESLGFSGEDFIIGFAQDIRRELPAPQIPEGYHFLDRMLPEYADRRADVHFHAFQPQSKMNTAYYQHFMTAPDYDPELDVVLVAPDGRFAAYAMAWLDADNKLSVFEPVGTRGELQGKGLGKAVQFEALRRLQLRGAETALVSTWSEDQRNIGFYQSVGFTPCNMSRVYTKVVSDE